MRKSLFVLLAVFICNLANASMSLSLSEAIRLAQQHSLDAKVARFTFLESYWSYRSYRAELLPSVSLGGDVLNYDRSMTSVRNYEDGRINYVENNSLTNALTMSLTQNIVATGGTISLQSYLYRLDQFTHNQRIYNALPMRLNYTQPLRTYNALKWRRKSEPVAYEQAKRQYVESMQNVAISVINFYFSVLSAQSEYKQALATEAERTRLYEQIQRRLALGTVTKSEVLQLELSAINARVAVKRHKLVLEDARFQLFTFMQASYWEDVELLPPYNVPDLILNEDDVVHRAMQASTHSLSQNLSLIESQRNLAHAKSQRGIQVSLHCELGLRNTANQMSLAYKHLQDNQIVGLSVSIPIFDWGVKKGRVRMAKANLDMVKTQIEQNNLVYRQELKRLVRQFNLQYEQCADALRAENLATERYELTIHRFEKGSINVTELNTALREKESARAQYINQLHTYWSDYYKIQRYTLWNYIANHDITFDFEQLIK